MGLRSMASRYVNGELTYEELDALTQLPKKKGE